MAVDGRHAVAAPPLARLSPRTIIASLSTYPTFKRNAKMYRRPAISTFPSVRSMAVSCCMLAALLSLQTGQCATLRSSCKKVGGKSIIDETGCDLVAVYVNRCSGHCVSYSFSNPLRGNQMAVFGKCCRMLDVEMIDVELTCGAEKRLVKIPSARECGCSDCA